MFDFKYFQEQTTSETKELKKKIFLLTKENLLFQVFDLRLLFAQIYETRF